MKIPNRLRKREQGSVETILIVIAFVLIFALVGWRVLGASRAANSSATTTARMPFGLFENSNNLQYSFTTAPNYAIQYYGWGEGFQTADANEAYKKGTEPFVELQTCGNPCDVATSVLLAQITAGKYDAYLTNFGEAMKAYGHPVLVTFDHEMNGSWYPWDATDNGKSTGVTAADWVAAWQHVIGVMKTADPSFTTVWAPNIEQGASAVAPFWPGRGYRAAHVDDIGLDGYFQNSGSNWANTFTKSVNDLRAVGGSRYFLVTETGVLSSGGNNASQISNLISGARSANAKGVMYFDSGKWVFTGDGKSEFVTAIK